MKILFIHRAFPAQFGRLALELTRRYGWKCTCVFEILSRCPSPSQAMLSELELVPFQLADADKGQDTPWPQAFGKALQVGQAVFRTLRNRPDLQPDLVVGHGGLTPTFFLRELYRCPFVNLCEYFFAPSGRDLTYRVDMPPAEMAPFFPRCINAATLIDLVACDVGYAPTQFQRDSFPARFRSKIEVHADGIDTDLYRPRTVPRIIAGRAIPAETRVVTFAARGLESMRGFDLFMRVAARIGRERADVVFVVAGDDRTYYGWDRTWTGTQSFREWVLSRGDFDLSRFIFVGHVEPEQLAEILCLSNLHIYCSVPFVLSWSLLDAMASGCVVLAGDVAPVREVIEPGRNGLMVPLFDVDGFVDVALRVLGSPAEFTPLGAAARETIVERFGMDVATPELRAFYDRAVLGPAFHG